MNVKVGPGGANVSEGESEPIGSRPFVVALGAQVNARLDDRVGLDRIAKVIAEAARQG